MKKAKKSIELLPEVQILGDLEDVKILLKAIGKKRGLVLFRDAEQNISHMEIKGALEVISEEEISSLEKDFRFIYFDFFPGRKRIIPADAPPEEQAPAVEPEVRKKKVKKSAAPKKQKKEKKSKGKK